MTTGWGGGTGIHQVLSKHWVTDAGIWGSLQDRHTDGHSPPGPWARSSSRSAASSCCRLWFCFLASCRWLRGNRGGSPQAFAGSQAPSSMPAPGLTSQPAAGPPAPVSAALAGSAWLGSQPPALTAAPAWPRPPSSAAAVPSTGGPGGQGEPGCLRGHQSTPLPMPPDQTQSPALPDLL